ncbi:MAG: methyltransferase domain-containing protein [Lachnospiraceae bacterium]|nr:methyltransferase domain-containing protein [Lachnospiraceae bacterium]MBR1598643.1 methyltransferase domain-containing protein [Lachnospiraceae bacterium]
MNNYEPTKRQQNQFIWKDPLPCIIDFGYELRRIGLNVVVDLGCRVGGNSIALAELGLEVIAYDSSELHLETVEGRAYDKHLDIKTVHQTSNNLPFEDESIHAFVTATAIHHARPCESKELVEQIYRALIPGGRVLVAVLSTDDYRYGTGTMIDDNTFLDTTGPEVKNVHQFFTSETLLSLFDKFTPECEPYIVPSTYVMDTNDKKKQGKLLVGKFLKGYSKDSIFSTTVKSFNNVFNAKRSVELLFFYSDSNKLCSACIEYLNCLTPDMLRNIYCQCVIVGNYPISMVTVLDELRRFEGNIHFSLAYSEQTNEAQSLDMVIIDGITVFTSIHSGLSSDYIVTDNNPVYVNYFRQQLISCWKKATVLLDNGKKIQNNIFPGASDALNVAKESNVKVIDFAEKKKDHIRVGITQLDLNGILTMNEKQLYKPDLLKLPNVLDHVFLKASKYNLNFLIMPELSGDESLNEHLQQIANANNMVIIGGSYYDKRRVNCCPVAFPGRDKPYIIEKIHPSPFEISPNKDTGIVKGSEVTVFLNTVVGSFGVLICADFLNDSLVEDVCNSDIDFLCVVSMNGDSPRFFEKMNLKCQNCQRGIYILYSNCLFSTDGFYTDGLSSIFGFMDRIYLTKLKRVENKYQYQIISFNNEEQEGMLIADINLKERRPVIRSPESKPNITELEKVIFD